MKKLSAILLVFALSVSCSDDPCDGVVCNNGGTCDNGICVCPQGYEGPSCSTEKTPSKILITKIEVLTYPATTSTGGGWDIDSGPDTQIVVTNEVTDVVIHAQPNYRENSSGSYTYTPTSPIQITAVSSNHAVTLYDFDSLDPNDFIGGIIFNPSVEAQGFPATVELSTSTSTTNFRIHVTYQF